MSPILRQIDAANGVSLLSLLLGLLAAAFAVEGRFNAAALCLMYAGQADFFDGYVARRTKRTKLSAAAGGQIDSLVDVCSFGFAPAIVAYCFGLRDVPSIILIFAYVSVNVLRLAYFNAQGMSTEGSTQYFTGLPVTYAALVVPLVIACRQILPDDAVAMMLRVALAVLAIAMSSGFKVPKPKGVFYVIFPAGALAITAVYARAMLAGVH
ncbi:MAG: CDP-alcohol phosphatidyltransferase family protein [Minicystis sp.]